MAKLCDSETQLWKVTKQNEVLKGNKKASLQYEENLKAQLKDLRNEIKEFKKNINPTKRELNLTLKELDWCKAREKALNEQVHVLQVREHNSRFRENLAYREKGVLLKNFSDLAHKFKTEEAKFTKLYNLVVSEKNDLISQLEQNKKDLSNTKDINSELLVQLVERWEGFN